MQNKELTKFWIRCSSPMGWYRIMHPRPRNFELDVARARQNLYPYSHLSDFGFAGWMSYLLTTWVAHWPWHWAFTLRRGQRWSVGVGAISRRKEEGAPRNGEESFLLGAWEGRPWSDKVVVDAGGERGVGYTQTPERYSSLCSMPPIKSSFVDRPSHEEGKCMYTLSQGLHFCFIIPKKRFVEQSLTFIFLEF